ncbi:penicillin-binding protein, beta-lactamase class C [Belliella baltica DSM 15883]|uniref:Penicillin-binding protein, beta-lactamase class C n=1 Tax=Belliella baltica (strain DSM 15883 / CIP 108006 / LMG 21964 / BA134) TaxID=866536 RepID=I3Z6I0_BELBD|nr:serine hydrolase domain-containing protein [Belliella baltica]AFL84848.1 penicillin-binding protein, beta-lactamase class C [Belliella baltica DSM 15883]
MKNKFFAFSVVALMITNLSFSQVSNVIFSTAEKVNQDSLHNINLLLEKAVDNQWIAGAVALVAIDGEIVYENAFGFRNIALNEAMKTDDIFRMASMTKPITSIAILKLYEEGKLDFKDPVSKYIPEFSNPQILVALNPTDSSYTTKPASREVTIHDLLTHTSGISYGFADTLMNKIYAKEGIIDLTTLRPIKLEESIAKLAKLPLKHEPGEKFTYGLSIDVLGRVVEVASGLSFDQYLLENIFDPLGMDDTRFYFDDETQKERVTTMYANTRSEPLVEFPENPNRDLSGFFPIKGAKTYFSGGAGLSSTAQDYFKFCQMVLNDGELNGVRVLKEETIAFAKNNQIGEIRMGRDHFTYGYQVVPEDGDLRFGRIPGKISWGGAFQTTFWIDPARNSVAMLLTQMYPSYHQQKLYGPFEQMVNGAFETGN